MADVILDGILLNRSIQWIERFSPRTTLNQVHKRAVDGSFVVYQKEYAKGTKVTLSGAGDTGWFTKEMIDSIDAVVTLSNHQMTLDYKGETLTVMFDWSTGKPVSFTPIKSKETYDATDWFQGELHLVTV